MLQRGSQTGRLIPIEVIDLVSSDEGESPHVDALTKDAAVARPPLTPKKIVTARAAVPSKRDSIAKRMTKVGPSSILPHVESSRSSLGSGRPVPGPSTYTAYVCISFNSLMKGFLSTIEQCLLSLYPLRRLTERRINPIVRTSFKPSGHHGEASEGWYWSLILPRMIYHLLVVQSPDRQPWKQTLRPPSVQPAVALSLNMTFRNTTTAASDRFAILS